MTRCYRPAVPHLREGPHHLQKKMCVCVGGGGGGGVTDSLSLGTNIHRPIWGGGGRPCFLPHLRVFFQCKSPGPIGSDGNYCNYYMGICNDWTSPPFNNIGSGQPQPHSRVPPSCRSRTRVPVYSALQLSAHSYSTFSRLSTPPPPTLPLPRRRPSVPAGPPPPWDRQ